MRNRKATMADFLIAGFLFLLVLAVVVPFINTIAISFSTQREYLNTPLLLIPRKPTLNNYINLLRDKRISIGYLTSLKILLLAYGTSRKNYPGERLILGAILFTMLFNGGILPLYLQMRELHLTNTIWSVILASGINVFYFVLARNYFCSLPEALIESAQLDGAGEWKILFSIILPISKPILATLTLFYMVDRWNEWYNALIFIHDNSIIPLQVVLRSIVMESNISSNTSSAQAAVRNFDMGIKMGAVMLTSLPIMCVFPFLQKHFAKGVMVGAIKA